MALSPQSVFDFWLQDIRPRQVLSQTDGLWAKPTPEDIESAHSPSASAYPAVLEAKLGQEPRIFKLAKAASMASRSHWDPHGTNDWAKRVAGHFGSECLPESNLPYGARQVENLENTQHSEPKVAFLDPFTVSSRLDGDRQIDQGGKEEMTEREQQDLCVTKLKSSEPGKRRTKTGYLQKLRKSVWNLAGKNPPPLWIQPSK